jgi:hypothetical protein
MRRFAFSLLATTLCAGAARADTWSLSTIDPTMNTGWTVEMAFDAGLHPHVAYWFPSVTYAYYDGVAWHLEPIPPTPEESSVRSDRTPGPARSQLIVTVETDLALTPDGAPWIAQCLHDADDGSRGTLEVSHKEAGVWVTEAIDRVPGRFELVSGADGTPWLSYVSATLGPRLAHRTGTWSSEPLFTNPGVLALDRQGTLWITHYAGIPSGLWVARRTAPGQWTSTLVDSTPLVSTAFLQFDSANRPCVAYVIYDPGWTGFISTTLLGMGPTGIAHRSPPQALTRCRHPSHSTVPTSPGSRSRRTWTTTPKSPTGRTGSG